MDSPYSLDSLSEAETDALEAALGDGFIEANNSTPSPLPKGIPSGLLRHAFYCRIDMEYDSEEWDNAFWESPSSSEGVPAPFESFPLHFDRKRMRIYFQNQLDRFGEKIVREEGLDSLRKSHIDFCASNLLYEKPWYEFNAICFLNWIEISQKDVAKSQAANMNASFISSFSGQLGRLMEQYYWRFRFEEAAVTGIGARKGASAGGKAKARLQQAEHSVWQKEASEIWARRPELSKIAVAEAIRKRFGDPRTAKHIARYIIRP